MISEDFIIELKNRCDIGYIVAQYVNLKNAGKNKICKCPFHSDKTPSMVVYENTQSFYCFGCGVGGDVITFIKNIEHLEYAEAVEFLAKKVGLKVYEDTIDRKNSIMRKKILEINKVVAKFYFSNLSSVDSEKVREYLNKRKISPQYIKKFGLGFAKDSWDDIINLLYSKGYSKEEILEADLAVKGKNNSFYNMFRNRLIFPIIDLKGNVIAFGGRILSTEGFGPKYLNSSDTLVFKKSNNVYALNFAKNTKKNYIILVEGYMDVISLYQAGFDNVVAALGTSLTHQQAKLISTYTGQVMLSYDSDEAGEKAANRAMNILNEVGVSVKILDIKDAKDPDEYIKKFGKEKFHVLVKNSKHVLDFQLDSLKRKYDIVQASDKINFLKDIVNLLSHVSNPLEREVYISKISQELDINKDIIALQIKKKIKKQISEKRIKQSKALNQILTYNKNNYAGSRVKYIIAEEKIITILIKNPDFYNIVSSKLTGEDFEDTYNQEIFKVIMQRLKDGLQVDITSLSNVINETLVKKVAYLLASDLNINFNENNFLEYINVLKKRQSNDVTNLDKMNNDEFKNYFKQIKDSKFK